MTWTSSQWTVAPRWTLFAILLTGLLSGCSTMEIYVDHDPDASFENLKRYAWMPDPPKVTGDPRVDNPIIHRFVREAVEDRLKSRGFERDDDAPDVWVGFIADVRQRTEFRAVNERRRYSSASWTELRERAYDEGTLILDFVDPKTRKLLWRGSARAEVHLSASQSRKRERIKEAVDRILERFPPSRD